MNRDALVVGINRYPRLKNSLGVAPHLETAANDAEAIARLLETQGRFTVRRFPETVVEESLQVKQKETVTTEKLKKAIASLFNPNTTTPPDVALLYFAGHGLRQTQTGDVTEGYLATTDTNCQDNWGVSLLWLRQLLQRSPVKQQIVWLDCCHSGELFNFSLEDLQVADSDKVRFFVAAAREFEEAYPSLTSEHGALTELLLQGLNADHAYNGVVTSTTLQKFIQRQLLHVPQKPIIYCPQYQPIALTATSQKEHILEQGLGKRRGIPPREKPLSQREYRNRQALLSQVRTEVESRLKDPLLKLLNTKPINLK